jgi:RNA polymerase sigma-70 factor (ECF subfamily)
MDKIPEQQRNIFKMSREEGLSNGEIAEKLDLSIRTVENQIYRASKFLREHLKEEYLFALLILFGMQ